MQLARKESGSLLAGAWNPISSPIGSWFHSMGLFDSEIQEKETKTEVEYEIPLPKFKKEEVKISACGNLLRVHAKHGKSEYDASLTMSNRIDIDSCKAHLEDGMLDLKFKKRDPVEKEIQIE